VSFLCPHRPIWNHTDLELLSVLGYVLLWCNSKILNLMYQLCRQQSCSRQSVHSITSNKTKRLLNYEEFAQDSSVKDSKLILFWSKVFITTLNSINNIILGTFIWTLHCWRCWLITFKQKQNNSSSRKMKTLNGDIFVRDVYIMQQHNH